jgi:hypothetical protein
MPVGGLGHRAAALLDERDRLSIGERCGSRERRVLPHGMADDEVGLDADGLHRSQARERGRDEGRLLDIGARQLLDRALEADLGDVVADGLGRLVVDGTRFGEALGEGAAHADVLRALAREAKGDLHAVPLPQTV